MTEDFVPVNEVYLLGPQFCGGEKKLIALVGAESLRDADVRGLSYPPLSATSLSGARSRRSCR